MPLCTQNDADVYCPCCGLCKPPDAFGADPTRKNGLRGHCNECRRAARREAYQRLKRQIIGGRMARWPYTGKTMREMERRG